MTTTLETDILIIGGGLVGGPLAALLAAGGLRVAVVERESSEATLAPSFDGRASAVALGAQRVLEAAGLWSDILPYAAPIKHIRVSDGASPLFLHYDHRAVAAEAFGWIVENRAMRSAIARRFADLADLHLCSQTHVAQLERGVQGVSATLADGRRISAQLVVAADGRASPTREGAGIPVTQFGYGQSAIVCTIAHERPHNDTAQEHFLPSGPFALLPLTGRRSSIVWTDEAHRVPAILAQDAAAFRRELTERCAGHLGAITLEGERFAYPIALQFAHRYYATRLALLGDAAHGMHPVAGQGMNMGLRDVAALAEVVIETHRLGLDLGSDAVLTRYGRWRRFDNLLMLGLTDGLVRLFSNDIAPLRLARSLGLAAVERAPALKRTFMRHAMGLVGELPKLMRGEAL